MIAIAPTAISLIELFKRRGIASHHVLFWGPHSNKPVEEFGLELSPDEQAAISMTASESCGQCWLTTKRFVWLDEGEWHQILLNHIADVGPRVLRNQSALGLALELEDLDKNIYDIRMPETGVLNGFIAVLHRIARRAR